MRYLLPLLFVLVLSLPDVGTAQTFQVKASVSDVTGVETIASDDLRPLPNTSYPGSHAAFRAAYEKSPDGDTAWTLVLFGYAPDTTAMSRASQVRLRADGAQLEPQRVGSSTRRLNGTLLEVKRLFFTRALYTQIARADAVTISVGPVQFKLDRVRRTDLRLILDRVSTAPAKQATEADTNTTQDNKGDA